MSDYIIIALLTLAVYYPLTLGGLAVMMFFAWRRRRSPYWRLGLALLALLFVAAAARAGDRAVGMRPIAGVALRGRYAVLPQPLAGVGVHPVGGPGRAEANVHLHRAETGGRQPLLDSVEQKFGGRAAGIGWGEGHAPAAAVAYHVAHHAQIGDRQHRQLGIADLLQAVPNLRDFGGLQTSDVHRGLLPLTVWVGALQELHLRQQRAEVFAVLTLLAAVTERLLGGQRQRRLPQRLFHLR